MDDLISRQAALDAIDEIESEIADGDGFQYDKWRQFFCELPSAEPESCEYWDAESKYCALNRPSAQHEITEEEVKKYCYKRCLTVITDELFHEMQSRWSSAEPRWIPVTERLPKIDMSHPHHNGMSDFISRQAAIHEAFDVLIDGEVFRVVQVETLLGLPSAEPEIYKPNIYDPTDTEKLKEALKNTGNLVIFPSAQPERKKGKWKWEPGRWDFAGKMRVMTVKCPCCGEEATSLISTDGLMWDIEMLYKFCPNCGADMRGEADVKR